MTAPYRYDRDAAERAVDFFAAYLIHVDGEWAGRPFTLADWQAEQIIRPLFGWKRPDGTRRYRTVYIFVPRKNGKSALAACIALYLTFCDHEPGAQVVSAAADREQAAIVFEVARKMIEAKPALMSRVKLFKRAIVAPATGSVYKVLSSDAFTKHGLHTHGIIFDELHAQPNRELWDVLRTSRGARRQPVTFTMTTAGYDRGSICWEVHDYATKVAAGILQDDSFLPVLFGLTPEDLAADPNAWLDPAVWRRCNPNLGVSKKVEYMEQEALVARVSPAHENTFKRLELNLWTEQAVRWMPMHLWDACAGAVDAAALTGRPCYAGLDLASTTDLAALVLLFPPQAEGERYQVLPYYWAPEQNTQALQRDRADYATWVHDGSITTTAGNVIDFDVIRQHIGALGQTYEIKEIAIDRWNSTQLQTQLLGDGFVVAQFGQGFASMSAPTKALLDLVLSQRLSHGGHPVLRWNAGNVAVKQDAAGNLKPDKEKSSDKIDGLVSVIMALGRCLVQPIDAGSVYDERGIVSL
jgi:phage terminase large subunit-like protein